MVIVVIALGHIQDVIAVNIRFSINQESRSFQSQAANNSNKYSSGGNSNNNNNSSSQIAVFSAVHTA
jgi:hypothetical protein